MQCWSTACVSEPNLHVTSACVISAPGLHLPMLSNISEESSGLQSTCRAGEIYPCRGLPAERLPAGADGGQPPYRPRGTPRRAPRSWSSQSSTHPLQAPRAMARTVTPPRMRPATACAAPEASSCSTAGCTPFPGHAPLPACWCALQTGSMHLPIMACPQSCMITQTPAQGHCCHLIISCVFITLIGSSHGACSLPNGQAWYARCTDDKSAGAMETMLAHCRLGCEG